MNFSGVHTYGKCNQDQGGGSTGDPLISKVPVDFQARRGGADFCQWSTGR